MPFTFKKLDIPGLLLVESKVFSDERGLFVEIYKFKDFAEVGIRDEFSQVNYSKSKKNVLRGLHYQKNPYAQGKLISVVEGEIFDVAVDIRKNSPAYGRWFGVTLSSEKKNMFYIPEGFAHGFCVTSESAGVIYYCTNVYSTECDRGIIWNDPTLNIDWPVENPILSEKDAKLPPLEIIDNDFVF